MSAHRFRALSAATVAAVLTLVVLDLVFLGVVAKPFYDAQLGPLRNDAVHWPAAVLFYAMYLTYVVGFVGAQSATPREAIRRGAGVGLLAYATYELTNWAVIRGWPAALVPVDIAWGVFLTALTGLAAHVTFRRLI